MFAQAVIRIRSALTVHAEIDANACPKDVVVSIARFDAIKIDLNDFHGDHLRRMFMRYGVLSRTRLIGVAREEGWLLRGSERA